MPLPQPTGWDSVEQMVGVAFASDEVVLELHDANLSALGSKAVIAVSHASLTLVTQNARYGNPIW